MSATPTRRRLVVRAVAGAAVGVLALAGCTSPQRAPSDYAGAEEQFLKGCVEVAEQDAKDGAENAVASPKDYCTCVWEAVSDPKTGLEFERFKEINSDLTEEGGELPKDIRKIYDSCDAAG